MNPYPAYKPSGIEWLGEIPAQWDISQLIYVCHESKSINKNNKISNVLSLSYGKIIKRDVETNLGLMPESFNTYQVVCHGDIILRLTDLQNDKRSLRVGICKENGIITSAYICLKKSDDVNSDYLFYLLYSYDLYKVFYNMGGGLRQTLRFDELKKMPVLLPANQEQINIANYLDSHTYLIDTLIEKKQRLIELLKEYRTVLINQAVTKGLDPNVKMKDSGIEWLGEVPEHWEVKRLKYSAKLIMEKDIPIEGSVKISPEYVESYTGKISNRYSDYAGEGMKFKPGDILFNKLRVYLAKVLYVEDLGYSMGEMIVIRSFDIQNKYLFYSMLSSKYIDYCNACSYGVKQPRTSIDDILNSNILIPEFEDQRHIVQILDNKTQQIDTQIEKEQKFIEYLKEYRTALVSEVVTGKLDVSDYKTKD
jgi:type I restriction enzyme S subunit